MVNAPPTARAPDTAYFQPSLPRSVADLYDDFDSVKIQELGLKQWVTLFVYVKESVESHGTVEPKKVQRLTKPDATPRKWVKIDVDSPPDMNLRGGVPEVDEWIWGWYGQYAT